MNDQTFRYAEPLPASDLGGCWFYHSMDIPGVGRSRAWDMRGKFKQYMGGLDVRGRTFLDVGTVSGFLLFEAEKHGANGFRSSGSTSCLRIR